MDTDPRLFDERREAFGSITEAFASPPNSAGDLPALLRSALSGRDPRLRHVGRTTIRGIEVDHLRFERDLVLVTPQGGAAPPIRHAPREKITIARDIYLDRDDALPVRIVDHLGAFRNAANTMDVTEFTDVRLVPLDDAGEAALELADHPGAKRVVLPPFDDSAAERGR